MSLYFPNPADFAQHTIFPGVIVQTCHADRMMLCLATLDANSIVELHSHPHEQVGMVIKGQVIFQIGDEKKTLKPGEMYRIPGNTKHRVVCLEKTAKVLDIFNPIREDYL